MLEMYRYLDESGINEDWRERLFRWSANIESDGSSKRLHLSKIVLESHGGSIELVDDQDLGGTRFVIRIPAS